MSSGPFLKPGDVKRILPDRGAPFDVEFQKAIGALVGYESLGIAVVDLTTPANLYASTLEEHKDKHVFSLAKLAPFVAAYRLRERLRNEFGGDPSRNSKDLIAKIESRWKSTVRAQVNGRQKWPDFPNLQKIFDLTVPPWRFNFKGDHTVPLTDLQEEVELRGLEGIHNAFSGAKSKIAKAANDALPFMQRMKLMIRISDNMASGSVASDIGMAYMFGVLTSEGLYTNKPKAHHGLWLSNTYGYDGKNMGVEGSGNQLTAGATAFSIAEYFTRLFRGSLVDKEASQQMLRVLRFNINIGTMSAVGTTRQATHSKLGYQQPIPVKNKKGIVLRIIPQNVSEGAIVESFGTDAHGNLRKVTYIAVGLQDVGGGRMFQLIDIMDAHVKKMNNLT